MSDWDIVPEAGEKSTTGYVGIKNLGCICYMNALLQQMYMIPSFRDDILSVDDPNKTLTHDDNPLFQTQCLFTALSESVKQYYNPKLFCHAFKDWEGKSINVFEQMDVDEFFSLFLDKLESAVKGTVQEKTVKHHFGGVFANQLLGKDCPHSSVREEPFLALNLQVKNKKSLQQCLESFVEGEMLQGSNAYYCEKCDKKVTALKRVCIKRLPRYMVCVLKRFDINYDTMQKFKINDYCEFPTKLNMEPYTEEGLAKKDREKERAKAKKEGRDIEEPPTQSKVQYPPAYYEYKLTGVVIHIGTADAGHYYSLAMDREKEWLPEKERWYEFNDTLVEHYDPEDIRDDAFGAEEHNNMPGVEGAMKSLGRLRNAYLLVYERAEPYEPPEEEDEAEKAHNKSAKTGLRETEISKTIHEAIMTENIKYWYNKFMFHEDYLEFARRLCLTWNSAENVLTRHPCKNYDYPLLSLKEDLIAKHAFQTEGKEVVVPTNERMEMKGLTLEALRDLDLLVYKYASTILLTTLLRSKSRTLVPDFIDICKAYQNKHVEAARWILWQFTNSKLLYEFLLECHEQEMRSLVVGLLYCAMLKVYERDKTVIAKCSGTETKECTLPNFANCIMQQLAGCRKFTIHFEQFFQLFARMTFLGGEMRDYFLRTGALKRLLGFWATLPDTKWNVFTELPFTENATPELGLPSVVDERFQSFFEEFYTLRREKAYQDAQPAYTFLFEAVSLLLRGTAAAEKSPLALAPETKYADGEFAIATVLKDPKLVSELIKDCRSSVSLNSMSQALVHISWANLELKNELTKGIVANVTEMEWDDLRKSFFFLRALLRAEDKTQKDYIDGALTALFKVMEACKKAYYATYYSIRYVMSLAKTEKAVAEWMAKNAEKWAWLCDWLKENPFPSHELTDVLPFKAKEQNDNSTMRNPGGLSAEEQQTWRSTTESFQKLLVKIKTGTRAPWHPL